MRIAIFIDNEKIKDVDCTDLESGNPGIGGTEYCILLLAQIYKKTYPDNEITLLAVQPGQLPKVDHVVIVKSPLDIENALQNISVDILVISAVYHQEPLPQSFFEMINRCRIKTIFWGHNFYLDDFCNKVSCCTYAEANVFVGRQQYDRYLDHKIINKSTYIFNMYPRTNYPCRSVISNHSVTYIGSLVPTKGFHILAQAWTDILKKVPDAELYVIGSGKLYKRNSQLGKYNIADEEYEHQFMPSLTDTNGNILPSVHFLGVLGADKVNIVQKTCVGVVNPSGRTETFGLSALDFESLGIPVVTIAKGGFLDTVIDHKTGLLYKSKKNLAPAVVSLLENPHDNFAYGKNAVELAEAFSPDKIIPQWHNLFETVYHNHPLPFRTPENFMGNNLKWLRWSNRVFKNLLHCEYPFSIIGLESFVRNTLRRLNK